jgi:hypothetical protein
LRPNYKIPYLNKFFLGYKSKNPLCFRRRQRSKLIDYSTEEAIYGMLDGRESDFVEYIVQFSEQYAECIRSDYRLFVDAFRNKLIPGI